MTKKLFCAITMLIITASCVFADANNDLFIAVIRGNMSKIQDALNAGADINAKDKHGRNVLMLSMGNTNTEIIRALINAGADINAVDNDGRSVKDYVVLESNPDIREMFKEMLTVQDKLFIALREAETTEEIQALIDAGASFEAKDTLGCSGLVYAVFNSNPAIIKMLVDTGLDVNEKFLGRISRGATILMAAAIMNLNADVMNVMINAGADVNAIDSKGKNALFYALDFRGLRIERVNMLLNAGVNVRQKDTDNNDALHYLINGRRNDSGHTRKELVELIKMLIRAGADVDERAGGRPSFREEIQNDKKYLDSKKTLTPNDKESLQEVNEFLELMEHADN